MDRLPSLGSLRSIANAYDEDDFSDEEETSKSKKRKLSTEKNSESKGESDLDIVLSDEEENSSGAGSATNVVVQPKVTKASRLVSYAGEEDEEDDAGKVKESEVQIDNEVSTSAEGLPDTLSITEIEERTQTSSLDEPSNVSESQPTPRSQESQKELETKQSQETDVNKGSMPNEIQDHLNAVKAIHVTVPDEPDGRCSNSLQEKIENLLEKKRKTGLDLKRSIQQKKNIRNPSIYEKLVSFCSITEIGTNYPASIYNPFSWTEDSFYERLSKIQKDHHEKKQKERSKVEFRSATKTSGGSTSGEAAPRPRRSKWDVTSAGTATLTLPASAVQTIASVQAVVATIQAKKV